MSTSVVTNCTNDSNSSTKRYKLRDAALLNVYDGRSIRCKEHADMVRALHFVL